MVLRSLLPQSDRSGQRVAGGKALLDHFVEPTLVDGVGEEFHKPRAERRQIIGFATREKLLIELYLLVDPGSPGVLDVCLQTRP